MATKNDCCVEHLIRTNRVTRTEGGSVISSGCTNQGERARCSACGKTWVFVIDEAAGVAWEQVIPKRSKK